MAVNKEVLNKMEAAARAAYDDLTQVLVDMSPKQREGADVVIGYFKHNYMRAGYKKLARKLVKEDINA